MATRTMSVFDPINSRKAALPPHYKLNTQYDPKDPMGNIGASRVSDIIRSWLIGFTYYDEALPRWISWIDKAFERNEECGMFPEFYHLQLYKAKAIGKWLMNGKDDIEDWENARIASEVCYNNPKIYTKGDKIGEGLDDYMAYAFQAQKYEEGINMYEKLRGKSPISLSKRLSPRKLAYAHCLNKLGIKKFDEEELFEAGRKTLQWNLEGEWLGRGGQMIAAIWLKIVYWHKDKSLTPFQTILKAYDNMPRVQKPDFIIELENPSKWSAIKAFFKKS
jgi:GNAT superfamily N-acetyltransferase